MQVDDPIFIHCFAYVYPSLHLSIKCAVEVYAFVEYWQHQIQSSEVGVSTISEFIYNPQGNDRPGWR